VKFRESFHQMMEGRGGMVLYDLPMTEPVQELMTQKLGTRFADNMFGSAFKYAFLWGGSSAGAWEAAYRKLDIELPHDCFIGGNGYMGRKPPRETLGHAWHLTAMMHPLAEIESLEVIRELPWDDAEAMVLMSGLPDQIEDIKGQGFVSTAPLECTVFESAWYLRGMDCLFTDLVEGNEIGDFLLDYFTQHSLVRAGAYAEAGADLIRLGDDVGTQRGMMMSVSQWRSIFKPRLAKIVQEIKHRETAKTWIQYHSDGDIRPIIPDLIEIGIDILNPIQPECMDFAELAREYGQDLAFSGMIGTQTTMPFGTEDDVRARVHEVFEAAAGKARIILAPTHVLEPDVPLPNITAFYEEVHSLPELPPCPIRNAE